MEKMVCRVICKCTSPRRIHSHNTVYSTRVQQRENEATGKTLSDVTSEAGRDFVKFKSKLTSSYTGLYGPVGRVDKLTHFKQYHYAFFLPHLSAKNSLHENNTNTDKCQAFAHYSFI